MKRNEILEKIRLEAKKDDRWMKAAARRRRWRHFIRIKNWFHLKCLRLKRKLLTNKYNMMKDFNEKWYLIGTVVGLFAGIALGWFMFN